MNIESRLQLGPASSQDLQSATGMSQAGVSRALAKLGNRVIKYRDGRQIRYLLTTSAFDVSDSIPICTIDATGHSNTIAHLRPLCHRGFYVEPQSACSKLLLGENRDGLFDDLPYFLEDLRPQGFIGRQIAQLLSQQSAFFSADPTRWNTDQIGRYLLSNSNDLPGNFQLGQLHRQQLHRQPQAIARSDYARLADNVIEGEIPGSSAGGEQPKFSVFSEDTQAHVIVKFSPRGNDPVAKRWRQILLTEFHAAATLLDHGLPAAQSSLFEVDGRLFLESRRFDRMGIYGRAPMISLSAIDAEFVGLASNWVDVTQRLFEQNLLLEKDWLTTKKLWEFGRQIQNTDMHLGNLSLSIDQDVFKLLPAYDMCSMRFAPKAHGELMRFEPKQIQSSDPMAQDFWQRVMSDERF